MKYTKENLQEAVGKSDSVFAVLRFLGVKMTGGSHSHVKKLIKKFEIDTSHFKGQGWSKGRTLKNSQLQLSDIFTVDRRNGRRETAVVLRRALKESGIPEECTECHGTTTWNGKPLVLQVDHIDGNCLNNRKENLRFLCPNCHSQTDNFGAKNIAGLDQ